MLNKEEGQLGTLKERMHYVIYCLRSAPATESGDAIDGKLYNAIYDLETLVKYLPNDWKFDAKTGRKIEKVK